MIIFLYEAVTGGGWFSLEPHSTPQGSLYAEGNAMLRALAADFSRLPATSVAVLRDARLPSLALAGVQEQRVASADERDTFFAKACLEAAAVVLIAPEMQGDLYRQVCRAEALGARLLSPGSPFVHVTSDKLALAELWEAHGVPTIPTTLLRRGERISAQLRGPLVVKPRDGCGSLGVQLLAAPHDTIDWSEIPADEAIVQPYRVGRAASIAALVGADCVHILPATWQRLAADGRFRYEGGSLPLEDSLQERAASLLRQALRVLPPATGFIGCDILLGDHPHDDCVVEINPRLTTSYLGLRALAETNLAEAMLSLREQGSCFVAWHNHRVVFTSAGEIAIQNARG
jgi:predicted ATP-grasp superfamily ATP-dependent carboligase